MDVEEEKRDSTSMLEQLHTVVEPADPEIAAGLRRIREDEKRHREEILDMLLKSDPYALPHPTTEHVQREKQKQAWLEQQKMEWLAKRQAEWEAAGKPTPWAEWIRERELQWAVTETTQPGVSVDHSPSQKLVNHESSYSWWAGSSEKLPDGHFFHFSSGINQETEARLPGIIGGLSMALARTFKIYRS